MLGHRSEGPFDAVTGAFSQTGHAIAQALHARGRSVRSITRAPPDPSGRIPVIPPAFDDPAALTQALRGCEVLHSTYWARFGIGGSFDPLVENSRILYDCARRAGVKRVVQVTVAHADAPTGIPYWEAKGRLESVLRESGLPHSILRPALIVGPQDTLINNVAWAMRRLPMMAMPGRGQYRVRPVAVDDLGELAAAHGERSGDVAVAAVGPESFTYREFLAAVRDAMGARCLLAPMPARAARLTANALGAVLREPLLGPGEVEAMRRGLLHVDGEATCPTRFSEWLDAHASGLGRTFHSQRRRAEGKEYPWHARAP